MIAQLDRSTDAGTEKVIKGSLQPHFGKFKSLMGSQYAGDPDIQKVISESRTNIVTPWSSIRRGSMNTKEGMREMARAYTNMFSEVESILKTKYGLEEGDPDTATPYNIYLWQQRSQE